MSTLYNPMECSLQASSVHGILQAKLLEWVAVHFKGDLPDSGIEPRSPTLQADSLPSETPGKPIDRILFSQNQEGNPVHLQQHG